MCNSIILWYGVLMSSSEHEPTRLPSPDCMIPTTDQIHDAVVGMHTGLIDAALLPMSYPVNTVVRTSWTRWVVEAEGTRLEVARQGELGSPATLGAPEQAGFYVGMQTGAQSNRRSNRLVAYPMAGALDLAQEPGTASRRMSQAQTDVGVEVLRSFLAGDTEAVSETVDQGIAVLGRGAVVRAGQKVTRLGDELPRTELRVEVTPRPNSAFSFEACVSEEGLTVAYKDRRDYDGLLGIELGQLVCIPDGDRVDIVPLQDRGAQGHMLDRIARDERIDQTRGVLTTGRLHEVQRRVGMTVQQLVGYRASYVAELTRGRAITGVPEPQPHK